MAKRILLFFLIFSALPVIATTRQIIDKFVSDPAFIPSSIGICITDVKTGETIASYNERQAVIPASTIKVITTATALRLYRPSFCLYTTVGHNRRNRNFTRRPCDTRRRRPVLRLGIPLSPHRRFHRPNHTKNSVQSHQIDRGSHSCR